MSESVLTMSTRGDLELQKWTATGRRFGRISRYSQRIRNSADLIAWLLVMCIPKLAASSG
jgi:hypothetical protein